MYYYTKYVSHKKCNMALRLGWNSLIAVSKGWQSRTAFKQSTLCYDAQELLVFGFQELLGVGCSVWSSFPELSSTSSGLNTSQFFSQKTEKRMDVMIMIDEPPWNIINWLWLWCYYSFHARHHLELQSDKSPEECASK